MEQVIGSRRLEPVEGLWVPAPCQYVERDPGEVDSVDVGRSVRREPVVLLPESPDVAWPEATGATGPLAGGCI